METCVNYYQVPSSRGPGMVTWLKVTGRRGYVEPSFPRAFVHRLGTTGSFYFAIYSCQRECSVLKNDYLWSPDQLRSSHSLPNALEAFSQSALFLLG